MKHNHPVGLALVLGGVLAGSASHAQTDTPSPDAQSVVAGNTAFATDLYARLRPQAGNLFFSPDSISTALAMTYGGARGVTEKQMAQTLHFELPADRLHPAFATLEDNLRAVQQKGQVRLAEANSLWPQKSYPFLPDYLALCQSNYGTSITPVDYKQDTEGARKTINTWVEDKTNRKIVELLKPAMVSRDTRLVLVNAIYFKGSWAKPFKPALTEDQPFQLTAQKSATTSLMRQTDEFGYAEANDLQVLALPYSGFDLSMVVLLPRQADGLGALENKLTATNLAAWTSNLKLQTSRVHVFLPKFKMTSEFLLGNTLAAMGMSDAFDLKKADFSGMDGQSHYLFIGDVIHKAHVEVNEQGTEAAAATAVTMLAGMAVPMNPPPIPVFRADHPFLFLIRNNHTGSILFLGRVTNPAQ